jgi:hypothetical protein
MHHAMLRPCQYVGVCIPGCLALGHNPSPFAAHLQCSSIPSGFRALTKHVFKPRTQGAAKPKRYYLHTVSPQAPGESAIRPWSVIFREPAVGGCPFGRSHANCPKFGHQEVDSASASAAYLSLRRPSGPSTSASWNGLNAGRATNYRSYADHIEERLQLYR